MMLFSEIYSTYYMAVAKLIAKAIDGELTLKNANEIINSTAFSDSFIYILDNIKTEQWQVISKDLKTPIKHYPKMPLTHLQKSFLKSIQFDPRFRLFCDEIEGLENIEPLYLPKDFYYFDKINDGDPYENQAYIKNFRTILKAIKEKRYLRIVFCGGKGHFQKGLYIPRKLEFSEKDDKFRLICLGAYNMTIINLARIQSCQLEGFYDLKKLRPYKRNIGIVILQIKNERNALERCMLHFANLKKETKKLDENYYEMKLYYYKSDETEVLIRILSFGPMIKVLSPQKFIDLIIERLQNQKSCEQI